MDAKKRTTRMRNAVVMMWWRMTWKTNWNPYAPPPTPMDAVILQKLPSHWTDSTVASTVHGINLTTASLPFLGVGGQAAKNDDRFVTMLTPSIRYSFL
jgi:hypothetical protein